MIELIIGFFPVDGKSFLEFGLEFFKGQDLLFRYNPLSGILGKLSKCLKMKDDLCVQKIFFLTLLPVFVSVLFCFALFCFFWFVLFVLSRFVSFRFVSFRFVSFSFVLFCFVFALFLFVFFF